MAIIIGYLINIVLLDGILQAPFADSFIAFCENVLQLDYYAAQNAYNILFRQNKPLWLAVGFIILLLVIFLYCSFSFHSLF